MAGNLGYKVEFALDATTAFPASFGGIDYSGAEVMAMTAANLDGEFAKVCETSELVEKYARA
jgi:hypothetical protein